MTQRLLHGWSFIRLVYLLAGTAIIIQSILERQWFMTLFGAYFASMGLFNYGCAAGACYTAYKPAANKPAAIQDIPYEEVGKE